MKFFSVDSPLYKFMNRLMDVFKLNCMWLLCSLPIVTMGAATTAAYTITLKMVKDEEGYIAGPFWKEFKANLKKGSYSRGYWHGCKLCGISGFSAISCGEAHNIMFLIIGVVGVYLIFMHMVYAFPLMARYENSIINTMRNSYSIAGEVSWQNSISGSASGDRDGDHYVESDNYVCRSFNWTGMYHFHDQRFCQYVLRGHRERKSHG